MKRWLVVAALYFAITLAMATPFIGLDELGDATFAGDGRLIVWTMAWTCHALLSPTPLFAANMFFPTPNALAYTEHMLGLGLLALPFQLITENPVLTFSILWLAAFWANAMAAHLLAFRFTGRHDAAIVGGLVYGWTFFRMSHAGHLQLQWTAWIPLAIWLFERCHDHPTLRRLWAATAVMLLQMLTSWYFAVLAAMTMAFWLSWLFVVKGTKSVRSAALQLVLAALVTGCVLTPLALPYLSTLGRGTRVVLPEYSADWRSYLSPPEDTWVGRQLEQVFEFDLRWIWGEQTLFIGFIACALALIGAAVVVAGLISTERDRQRSHAMPLFFVALTLMSFWLSLGPSVSSLAPFDVLQALPGLSLFRAPARFGLLVALGVGVLGAIGLAWCWERFEVKVSPRPVPLLTALLTVAMLGEWRVVTDVGRTSHAPIPPIYNVLNGAPPGALISLPDYRLSAEPYFRADYLLYSTAHWRPIVNGYGRDEPPDYLSTVKTLSTFPSGEAAALARAIGVRYFVLHTGRLPASTAVEDAQRGGLFRLLHKIGTDYLFEVTP